MLLVPGDCPALDPGEVATLLARQGRAGVVIVPDRHGAGTNALLLSPPDVIEPSFGPGSFARHAARTPPGPWCASPRSARSGSTSTRPTTCRPCARRSRAPGAAPRTRELLARMLPARPAG